MVRDMVFVQTGICILGIRRTSWAFVCFVWAVLAGLFDYVDFKPLI